MNANERFSMYNCTENYYKYFAGMVITDGVKALAETFKCFWFLDIVASYQQHLKSQEFQVWQLLKNVDGSALIKCTDGNDIMLKQQLIPFTDFEATTASVWVEYNVILLPSEH